MILEVTSANNVFPTLLFTHEAEQALSVTAIVEQPRDKDIDLLHSRTGHLSASMLNRLIRTQAVHGVEGFKPIEGIIKCSVCSR